MDEAEVEVLWEDPTVADEAYTGESRSFWAEPLRSGQGPVRVRVSCRVLRSGQEPNRVSRRSSLEVVVPRSKVAGFT